MRRIISTFLLLFLLSSCIPKTDRPNAEKSMRGFFHALASGDYDTAATLYGGDYESLIHMNPSISPTEHALLWQNGCEWNGFVCMEVLDVVSSSVESDLQIKFKVTFEAKEGGRFEFNGCCGEALQVPITEYTIVVQRDKEGNYKVLSLPPYVP